MIDYKTERFFDGIEDDQLQLIEKLLSVVIEEDESDRDPMQVREVLPVEEWCNYKNFLGPFAKDLYPYWKAKAPEYINSNTPELILDGSIGGGKTTFALAMQAYKLYVLSCYRYPQRLFGLSDITDIFFAYLSINFTHAERTGYGQFRSMIDSIPYFQKEFQRDPGINSVLKFPGRINIIPGTDNLSVVSTNLFGCLMDEADFYRKGSTNAADAGKAASIYREVTDRRTSRFMVKGFDNGFSAIISSASFQSTFLQQRKRKALQDKSGFVITTRLWDANPEKYTDKRFWIFKGTDKDDAYVVDSVEDVVSNAAPEMKEKVKELALFSELKGDDLICSLMGKLPAKYKRNFVEVPREFRRNFEEDVYGALRNIAGEAVSPAGKLYSSRALWMAAISKELRHPFSKLVLTIGLRGKERIESYFIPELLFKDGRPIRHPWAKRYFHIDQSTTTDRTGIVCVHIAEWVEDPNTLLVVPVVEVDFALAVEPPKSPDKISIAKCRAFIFTLRSLGMKIGKGTYDQFQSSDSIQIMLTNNIDAGLRSVDRDDKAYLQVCALLDDRRLRLYDYPIMKEEFFDLDHDLEKHKVDHPKFREDGAPGSKDVTDGLAGAIANALEDTKPSDSTTSEDIVNGIRVVQSEKQSYGEKIKNDWVINGYTKSKMKNPEIKGKKFKGEITGILGGDEPDVSFF